MKLGANMLAMLKKVQSGKQPKDDLKAGDVRAAGAALRALLAKDLLAVTEPFVYRLTEKGEKALREAK